MKLSERVDGILSGELKGEDALRAQLTRVLALVEAIRPLLDESKDPVYEETVGCMERARAAWIDLEKHGDI